MDGMRKAFCVDRSHSVLLLFQKKKQKKYAQINFERRDITQTAFFGFELNYENFRRMLFGYSV